MTTSASIWWAMCRTAASTATREFRCREQITVTGIVFLLKSSLSMRGELERANAAEIVAMAVDRKPGTRQMDESEGLSAGPTDTPYSEGGESGEYWMKHLSTTAGGIAVTGKEMAEIKSWMVEMRAQAL
jgi:hypothetical protein